MKSFIMLFGYQTEKGEMIRYVTRTADKRNVYGVWWWNVKERDRLDDVGLDGRIIPKMA